MYAESASTLRDATKWLVAFIPAAALLAGAIAVAPDLAHRIRSGRSVGGDVWGWAALVFVGLGLILGPATTVLTVHPRSWTELGKSGGRVEGLTGRPKTLLDEAEADGVFAVYYQSKGDLYDAILGVWTGASDAAGNPIEPDKKAVAAAAAIHEYSIYRATRTRFKVFLGAGAVGAVMVIAALVGLLVEVDEPSAAPISAAVQVQIAATKAATAEIADLSGCAFDQLDFAAVGGDWEEPLLVASGPGCRMVQWRPAPGHIVMRAVPQAP